MFDKIAEFFRGESPLKYDKNGETTSSHIHFAVTALLWQIITADESIQYMETDKLFHLIASEFGLSAEDSNELMSVVEHEENKFKIKEFLDVVKEYYTVEQRKHIVSLAQKIALSDDTLDGTEAITVDILSHQLGIPKE